MTEIEPELAVKLLREEYPDEMAARSCTCEHHAMCGAHRLLKRYEDLYAQLVATNGRFRAYRERQAAVAPGETPT